MGFFKWFQGWRKERSTMRYFRNLEGRTITYRGKDNKTLKGRVQGVHRAGAGAIWVAVSRFGGGIESIPHYRVMGRD